MEDKKLEGEYIISWDNYLGMLNLKDLFITT